MKIKKIKSKNFINIRIKGYRYIYEINKMNLVFILAIFHTKYRLLLDVFFDLIIIIYISNCSFNILLYNANLFNILDSKGNRH